MQDLFLGTPHRRWNPLSREWVIVSPHRTQRPWQGQREDATIASQPAYDPTCYLCPGNLRAGGYLTPKYTSTYVFTNDFAALKPNVTPAFLDVTNAGLLRATTERGECRVLCFDPRHDLTLATMDVADIANVVDICAEQETELAESGKYTYVQIFENRGAMMGASNPHPHGQIWATEHIPDEPARELHAQQAYFTEHGSTLLGDYLALELKENERIAAANETWVALVPFWAVWPFEVVLIPRSTTPNMSALSPSQRSGLAAMLKTVTAGYNRVFDTPFPYSMGFHPAPCDGSKHPEWTMHAHFFPPLLRSATIRKFMVGFELLGSPQRDITPEAAAATLRAAIDQSAQNR